MEPDARRASPPWAELPADALSEIAGRLHDVGDSVRFRAVCRPWHEAPPPARAPSLFLPWLVEPYRLVDGPRLLLHSPFSTRRTRHFLPLSALRGMEIHGSDSSSGRLLLAAGAGYSKDAQTVALVNPLDGSDAALLPSLPQSELSWVDDKWRSASGVVSTSGVVVFHTIQHDDLAATQLRPGKLDWEEVDMTCPSVGVETKWLRHEKRRAAALWSSVVLSAGGAASVIPAMPPWPGCENSRYVLEFRGELLCVDIVVIPGKNDEPAGVESKSVFVQVHRMQVEDDGWHQWVEREFTHLCFFLSSKSSFAVDAREFAGSAEVTGGCAYFCCWRPKWTRGREIYAVYKYSCQSSTATVVDELPAFRTPMWFMPRPRISPLLPPVQ